MSKPKGIIVIELPEVPEDCYHCNQRNGDGYCKYVGKFVGHLVKPGERHPLCPILEAHSSPQEHQSRLLRQKDFRIVMMIYRFRRCEVWML